MFECRKPTLTLTVKVYGYTVVVMSYARAIQIFKTASLRTTPGTYAPLPHHHCLSHSGLAPDASRGCAQSPAARISMACVLALLVAALLPPALAERGSLPRGLLDILEEQARAQERLASHATVLGARGKQRARSPQLRRYLPQPPY